MSVYHAKRPNWFWPPAAPRTLSARRYAEVLTAFQAARLARNLTEPDLPEVPELDTETANPALRAMLRALRLLPPPASGRGGFHVRPRIHLVDATTYASLEEAVIQQSGMEPAAARRRVDAALAQLNLTGPVELAVTPECPRAYLTSDGRVLDCTHPPASHPEPGVHEDWDQENAWRDDDERIIDLRELSSNVYV